MARAHTLVRGRLRKGMFREPRAAAIRETDEGELSLWEVNLTHFGSQPCGDDDAPRPSGWIRPLRSAPPPAPRLGRAPLKQIQTTERYLGLKQNLHDAPCDRLGIRGWEKEEEE